MSTTNVVVSIIAVVDVAVAVVVPVAVAVVTHLTVSSTLMNIPLWYNSAQRDSIFLLLIVLPT